VQVYGSIRILDQQETWHAVKRLTDRYEQTSKQPVSLETLPQSVLNELAGVVAFEIKVEEIDAVCKMSQNRDDKNYALVIEQLRKLDDKKALLVADIMDKLRPINTSS
jgi:transcriptional regulator